MQANTAPLLSILGASNARFIMPVYQRGYSWDRARRRELFDDVLWAGSTGSTHFVGSVLMAPVGGGTVTTVNRLDVVDGQQRLLTLTILLDRLLRRLEGDPDGAGFLDMTPSGLRRQYIVDPEARGDLRYRIDPTDADRATLWHLVGDAPRPAEPSAGLMDAAADFDEWLADEDPAVVWAGIRNLRAIDAKLDPDDDAQRIFESMNARGVDLEPIDLIRNWMLMHVPFDDQRAFHETRWLPLMRLLDGPDDAGSFIRQWLTSVDPTAKRRGGDVYRMFKDQWRARGWDSPAVASLMLDAARDWRDMFAGGERDARLAAAYRGVAAIGIIQIRPVMLALGRLMAAGRLDREGMARCCAALESYLIRRSALRMNNSRVSGMADRIIRSVRDADRDIPDVLSACLLTPDPSGSLGCPDDRMFRHALETAPVYRFRHLAAVILGRLEDAHHPNETVSGLTVEHIMPQTLNGQWRAALGRDADRIHDRWADTLGNLTLTGSNGELSNRGYADKDALDRKGYAASPLWLNTMVAGRGAWDADAIAARARILSSAALGTWPMPTAPALLVDRLRGAPLNRSKRPRLRFSMLGIRPGTELEYVGPGTPATVRTADEDAMVELDGATMTLSAAAARLQGAECGVQGARVFALDGETLAAMRDRLEGRAPHA